MASAPRSIPIIGLIPSMNLTSTKRWTDSEVQEAMMAQSTKAKELGYEMVTYAVDPANDCLMGEAKEKMRSKQLDRVSIYFGVRGNLALAPLFENLVNTIIMLVQPPPRMISALEPDKLVEAMQRGFSQARSSGVGEGRSGLEEWSSDVHVTAASWNAYSATTCHWNMITISCLTLGQNFFAGS
ncbi:hypothetical protein BDZ45DRAFT_735521 [Acephala macrosclerotiorum]|nr:hypothetical protein BDZ45DRAFT_735521 [Acephala macrosclerotiorum]